MTYRLTSDARLRMLTTTARELGGSLGDSDITVHASDASDDHWHSRAAGAWAASTLEPVVERTDAPLLGAIEGMVAAVDDVFCLQFDDTITVGMDVSWLDAAALLVRRFRGQVDVVVPQWPVTVTLDADAGEVRVVPHRRKGDRYRFWIGGWQRPVHVAEIGGARFGIFENFTYGFHFNNLVGDAASYLRRLGWYRTNVSADSAHAIELAAYTWQGPSWPHIAIPLDGVCLLDLDYEHTAAAVRGEAPERRLICDLLDAGGRIVLDSG